MEYIVKARSIDGTEYAVANGNRVSHWTPEMWEATPMKLEIANDIIDAEQKANNVRELDYKRGQLEALELDDKRKKMRIVGEFLYLCDEVHYAAHNTIPNHSDAMAYAERAAYNAMNNRTDMLNLDLLEIRNSAAIIVSRLDEWTGETAEHVKARLRYIASSHT